MTWRRAFEGSTLGLSGPEGGIIVLDEEHPAGARLTMEQEGGRAHFAIISSISGWMVHTRFFETEDEARMAFEEMKPALEQLTSMLPADGPGADLDA